MADEFDPTDPNKYPLKGAMMGPAWRALLRELINGKWHCQVLLSITMMEHGGVAYKTAYNMIDKGIKVGFLEKKEFTHGLRGHYVIRIRSLKRGGSADLNVGLTEADVHLATGSGEPTGSVEEGDAGETADSFDAASEID